MSKDLTKIIEYGPAMSALTELQRNFVNAYLEHTNWSAGALAEAAGFSKGPEGSSTLRVEGYRQLHSEKVLAAINEEASKRLRTGGAIGVSAVIKVALNENHKDHLKAALALMNRTGFHEMTEHKVTVDDLRPKTKAELIQAIRDVAVEAGLDEAAVQKLIGKEDAPVAAPDEGVIDVEFTEVDEEEIRVEDL